MSQKIINIPKSSKGGLNGLHFETGKPYDEIPIVILAHGFTGDQHEWGRFTKTAQEFNKAGFDAISFDFSGSGKNPREPVTLFKQVQDLKDVHEWVKSKGYKKINVLGLSFGGLTALVANLPNINATVFWAPGFYVKRAFPKKHIFLMWLQSTFSKKPHSMPSANNEPILIKYNFMKEVIKLDIDKILSNYITPSIVIQGDMDETVHYDWNLEAFQHMPQDEHHKFVKIEGAGHDFKEAHLDQFIENSINWINKYN